MPDLASSHDREARVVATLVLTPSHSRRESAERDQEQDSPACKRSIHSTLTLTQSHSSIKHVHDPIAICNHGPDSTAHRSVPRSGCCVLVLVMPRCVVDRTTCCRRPVARHADARGSSERLSEATTAGPSSDRRQSPDPRASAERAVRCAAPCLQTGSSSPKARRGRVENSPSAPDSLSAMAGGHASRCHKHTRCEAESASVWHRAQSRHRAAHAVATSSCTPAAGCPSIAHPP
jgi:hypothetical protein